MEFKVVPFEGSFRNHLTEGDRYFTTDYEGKLCSTIVTEVESRIFKYEQEELKIQRGKIQSGRYNAEFFDYRESSPIDLTEKAYKRAEKTKRISISGKRFVELRDYRNALPILNKQGLVMLVTPHARAIFNHDLKNRR